MKSYFGTIHAILTVILTVLFGTQALAGKEDAAADMFNKGASLFEEGQYDEAAASFRRSIELSPNWRAFYYLGKSESLANRFGLAIGAFESYLKEGGDNVPQERQQEVGKEIEALKKKIGYISVSGAGGAHLFVDGQNRGYMPLPDPVAITAQTDHQVTIVRNGKPVAKRTLQVAPGKTLLLNNELLEVTAKADAEQTATLTAPNVEETSEQPEALTSLTPESEGESFEEYEPKKRNRLKIGGYVTLGTGLAVLGGSLATGIVAFSMNKSLEDDCPNQTCSPQFWDKNDKANALGLTSNILLGVGGAVTAAGIVMVVLGSMDRESNTNDVALVPVAGDGIWGAALQGSF